jgi:hypothetical protein
MLPAINEVLPMIWIAVLAIAAGAARRLIDVMRP